MEGEITISGAKNSSLPILIASILTEGKLELHNTPHLQDVTTLISLLRTLNVSFTMHDSMVLSLEGNQIDHFVAPYDLVSTMRASIMVLGPLLARFGKAHVSLPGGCAIGSRPIDIHLNALKKMGAICEISNGYIHCSAPKGLRGATIKFPKITVTGTENIMMAATLAKGITILKNCAREPEIVDLANCLNKMGANIRGQGTDIIRIDGVKKLHGTQYHIIPDRIETGTYMIATAITGGHIKLKEVESKHMSSIIEKLREAGAKIHYDKNWIELEMRKDKQRAVNIQTAPYPDFPTDMQAQFIAFNSVAKGTSRVTETVFENRFMHVEEMRRMGAKIEIQHNVALVDGGQTLSGTQVMASDLRASASLIISALAADGESIINRIYHIDRGYERIEEKLQKLGAHIRRLSH